MWHATLEECMEQVTELSNRHRHFEFFYSPAHRKCAMKSLDPVPVETADWVSEGYDVDRMRGERVGYSCRIFPSPRERLFNEIEFSLSAEAGLECLQELVTLLHEDFPEVQWPLEYRFVRGEEAWLSPSYGRDSVTISAHEGAERPHQKFFSAVEEIFVRHQGRPHWGKVHSHNSSRLSRLYPRFQEFLSLRKRIDPAGRFLNQHLARIFEESITP